MDALLSLRKFNQSVILFSVLISYTHCTQGTEKKSPICIVTALVDRIGL